MLKTKVEYRDSLDLETEAAVSDYIKIREVWGYNLEYEMKLIKKLSLSYKYLAMDTEFPGIVVRQKREKYGLHNYQNIKDNVDLLKLIQLGFTFCNDKGELPLVEGLPSIWQFNFKDFRLKIDPNAKESIELLQQSGIDFETYEHKGVDIMRFGEFLVSSGIVFCSNIRWITFHGAYDLGYLLKACNRAHLPLTENEFLNKLKYFFPNVYDVKHIMKFCNLSGGLSRLAYFLQIKRIGPEHQAGSDSLLTARIFMKISKMYYQGLNSMNIYCGCVYGLGSNNHKQSLVLS